MPFTEFTDSLSVVHRKKCGETAFHKSMQCFLHYGPIGHEK